MAGRKPKPAGLRILQGNPGKRSIRPAVGFPVEVMVAPDYLGAFAREKWLTLEPVLRGCGIITVADYDALACYCSAYGDFRETDAQFMALSPTERFISSGVMGGIMRNPLARARDDARRDMMRYGVELGITPSARNKVGSLSVNKPNKFKGIDGGKK